MQAERSLNHRRLTGALLVQGGLILLAILLAAFAPPAHGQMLLVSLAGERDAAVARYARSIGAYPLGTGGRTRGVLVVGERASVLLPLLARGIVPTRPPLACGSSPS